MGPVPLDLVKVLQDVLLLLGEHLFEPDRVSGQRNLVITTMLAELEERLGDLHGLEQLRVEPLVVRGDLGPHGGLRLLDLGGLCLRRLLHDPVPLNAPQ